MVFPVVVPQSAAGGRLTKEVRMAFRRRVRRRRSRVRMRGRRRYSGRRRSMRRGSRPLRIGFRM